MNEVDNESLSTVIGNNIGTEKINDYILEIIKTIGSTSNSSEAYHTYLYKFVNVDDINVFYLREALNNVFCNLLSI